MKKTRPLLIETSDEFSSVSTDDSGENDEKLQKVGLDILRLPEGEFRRPKHFVESSDSSEGEESREYARFCELKFNAKLVKLGRSSKESESARSKETGDDDQTSSTSSDLIRWDESQVPEELRKWIDVSMYPEHVVERLMQYVPRESSEDLSDLDMVVTKPVIFPECETNEEDGTQAKSRKEDYDFCKPGCRVGKTVDQRELILQMDQESMIKELQNEMQAMGADNIKKYFSNETFTQLFEKQIMEYGIHDGSDNESRDDPGQQQPRQTPSSCPSKSQTPAQDNVGEGPIQRISAISSFRNVEASGANVSKKVTESLLKSSRDKLDNDKSVSSSKLNEESNMSSKLGEASRDKLSAIPEETQETSYRFLLEEEGEEEHEREVIDEGEVMDEEYQLDYDATVKDMSSSSLVGSRLSDLEKAWLVFLKVNLAGLNKRQVKVKTVKSNVRQQFKNKKKAVETDFLAVGNEVPILELEEEENNLAATDSKIQDQFKSYKEGEIRDSLVEFGLEEEFVDVLKKIPAQRPSNEMSLLEKEVEAYHTDSSLVNSDEMDDINAAFTRNVIVTPDSSKINKLLDMPYYLVPPDVRAPIKIGTSLQEAQEKMFASMKQNYFSTRVVYAFDFDLKKHSHESFTLMFRDYVMAQNAGYKEIGLLAGCLFTYENHHQGIVMVEGGEYQITKHFADLKATDIYLALKKSRILFVHTYIQEQYLKKWIFVSTNPPSGTETNIEPTIHEEKAKENLLFLTDKLNILFQHLESREQTIATNYGEIDLPVDVHLKLPAPQLIDFVLDYYALRPLHKFIDEIYSIPDTHDSSEDEQIFPEDVPYYAVQPEKHELSDILDYMVEDKSLRRKKLLEREVRKKMEAEGKPYKTHLADEEHDIQLMYDIDDLESVKQLDVDAVYVEKFDEAIKAKLVRVPYGRDLDGYDRIRRFKGRPEHVKMKKRKKKKKVEEEVIEERIDEELLEETEEEDTILELHGEEQEMAHELPGWVPVSQEKIPKVTTEPLEEIHGEREEEDSGKKRKLYKKLFRYYPEYKVPYRVVGPTISESTPSTARTLGLEEEEEQTVQTDIDEVASEVEETDELQPTKDEVD